MADLRNTAQKCGCEESEKGDFNGRKVPLKRSFNGQKVPLVNGRKVPLKVTGGVVVPGPWAEVEPLVGDFGEWEEEGVL
jgi:hypothetical protein